MLPKPPHVYYRGCGQNKDIENENIKLKKFRKTLRFYIIITLQKLVTSKGKLKMLIWMSQPIIWISSCKRKLLRYFNLEPSFKLRCCRARDLFGSQIPVTTVGFESQIFCIRSSYLTQLHRMHEIRSSNPPVVTVSCDPNKKSRARHHRKRKLFF